jgi:hypothetical protein
LREKIMRKSWLAAVVLVAAPIGSVRAQVQQDWVARYHGPNNLDDKARAIATDSAGNVYVAGVSCTQMDDLGNCVASQYVTLKYDSGGNQVWVATYSGPGNSTDEPTAMAIDSAGNVYVTGASWGDGTLTDYATIKYGTDGNQLWVARYDGPGSGNDRATALVLDANANVYVTGESQGNGGDLDYATIAYDSNGNELWEARYDGPANSDDSAVAIALDSSGNVYVTGTSVNGTRFLDYATLKYDPDGNQLWVARYSGSGDVDNIPAGIGLDAAGDVYVTGQSANTLSDYATVKYDTDGNQLWATPFHRPDHRFDAATAIAVDDNGNAYVTGKSVGQGTNEDYVTIKYLADGTPRWTAVYDGPHH